MIVSYVTDGFLQILGILLRNITIPVFEGLQAFYDYFSLMLDNGIGIFKFVFPSASRVIMLILIITELVLTVYYIIMWVIKKIPMINIH